MSIYRVQVQEYGDYVELPGWALTSRDVAAANWKWQRKLNLPQPPFQIDINSTSLKVRALGVTGIARVGNLDIEVVPKFLDIAHPRWKEAFWKILVSSTESVHDDLPTNASAGGESSFVDFLADLFIRSYWTGSARGLPRTYRLQKGSGLTLKGSFDPTRSTDFFAEPWRVPYVLDVFTEDTPLARLLRWTAVSLRGLVSPSNRGKQLSVIVNDLSLARKVPPHIIDARQIQLGAQYRGLEMAKDIGLLLLESSGLTHEVGEFDLPGFLWRSNTVFEEFVFAVCEKVADDLGLSVTKSRYHFGEVVRGPGKPLTMIPDVVFLDADGAVCAVADAKYKKISAEGTPVLADAYQMITAGHILGCPHVALIYPSGALKESVTWKVDSHLNGGEISLSTLHLNPMDILERNQERGVGLPIFEWLESQR